MSIGGIINDKKREVHAILTLNDDIISLRKQLDEAKDDLECWRLVAFKIGTDKYEHNQSSIRDRARWYKKNKELRIEEQVG